MEYRRNYDDPYRVLAVSLVATNNPFNVSRILNSNTYVRGLVLHEAKVLDISGMFLDCIDQELIANDMLRKKNARMKELGEFFYSELDIKRLRNEIRRFCEELDIEIPPYPTEQKNTP